MRGKNRNWWLFHPTFFSNPNWLPLWEINKGKMHYRQHAVIEAKHSRVSKHSALKHSPFLLGLEAARSSEGVHACAQAGAAGCREQLQLSQGKTPSTAPLPPLVSMGSKCTDRSEKSHRIFLLYPKEAKGLQTVHLYSPVLIQLSDLVRTAQFLIAVQNLEGSAEMQPHCVFVITCEQTPGFSYVLLLQWITHQMVQIKKSSYDEQLMNSPHHFKVLLFTSSTAPCMYFLSLTLFAYHQIQRLLLGQVVRTCRLWAPLQKHVAFTLLSVAAQRNSLGSECKAFHMEQKGKFQEFSGTNVIFFFSLHLAVIKINITGSY